MRINNQAVVAAYDNSTVTFAPEVGNDGVVIWYTGDELRQQIERIGSHHLFALGIKGAGVGVSIWEGSHIGDELVGAFRVPSEEEWVAIQSNKNPWG